MCSWNLLLLLLCCCRTNCSRSKYTSSNALHDPLYALFLSRCGGGPMFLTCMGKLFSSSSQFIQVIVSSHLGQCRRRWTYIRRLLLLFPVVDCCCWSFCNESRTLSFVRSYPKWVYQTLVTMWIGASSSSSTLLPLSVRLSDRSNPALSIALDSISSLFDADAVSISRMPRPPPLSLDCANWFRTTEGILSCARLPIPIPTSGMDIPDVNGYSLLLWSILPCRGNGWSTPWQLVLVSLLNTKATKTNSTKMNDADADDGYTLGIMDNEMIDE